MTEDWNASLYLRFERERTQPSRDLLARITIERPEEIVDLGCGPGNSTAILRERWPSARIVGVDNSPAVHPAPVYHDYLVREAGSIDLWETIYYHQLPDHAAILDWYRSTGLRPYLEALPDDAARQEFQQQLLMRFRILFPTRANGEVLLPFRRLFVVAVRCD